MLFIVLLPLAFMLLQGYVMLVLVCWSLVPGANERHVHWLKGAFGGYWQGIFER